MSLSVRPDLCSVMPLLCPFIVKVRTVTFHSVSPCHVLLCHCHVPLCQTVMSYSVSPCHALLCHCHVPLCQTVMSHSVSLCHVLLCHCQSLCVRLSCLIVSVPAMFCCATAMVLCVRPCHVLLCYCYVPCVRLPYLFVSECDVPLCQAVMSLNVSPSLASILSLCVRLSCSLVLDTAMFHHVKHCSVRSSVHQRLCHFPVCET